MNAGCGLHGTLPGEPLDLDSVPAAGGLWVEVNAVALNESGVSLVGATSAFEIEAVGLSLSDTSVMVQEEGGGAAFSARLRKQSVASATVPTDGERQHQCGDDDAGVVDAQGVDVGDGA